MQGEETRGPVARDRRSLTREGAGRTFGASANARPRGGLRRGAREGSSPGRMGVRGPQAPTQTSLLGSNPRDTYQDAARCLSPATSSSRPRETSVRTGRRLAPRTRRGTGLRRVRIRVGGGGSTGRKTTLQGTLHIRRCSSHHGRKATPQPGSEGCPNSGVLHPLGVMRVLP